ncbi:MAG: hypothetical protein JETT_2019 [Candidatus Jettenia ecosi]|uniref:Uncharacterized protein n=1 Tax=Candidatus Jettenia ecosi TaxID=2494326 RepID=A0A533QAK7_9BACT|nr:MAG: hypothetical protein JETT_2019 [Candidatus Jettenia ecosi]
MSKKVEIVIARVFSEAISWILQKGLLRGKTPLAMTDTIQSIINN